MYKAKKKKKLYEIYMRKTTKHINEIKEQQNNREKSNVYV